VARRSHTRERPAKSSKRRVHASPVGPSRRSRPVSAEVKRLTKTK
jgi:hypothetical protein